MLMKSTTVDRALKECIDRVGLKCVLMELARICYERGHHTSPALLHPTVLTHEQAHLLDDIADKLGEIIEEIP